MGQLCCQLGKETVFPCTSGSYILVILNPWICLAEISIDRLSLTSLSERKYFAALETVFLKEESTW